MNSNNNNKNGNNKSKNSNNNKTKVKSRKERNKNKLGRVLNKIRAEKNDPYNTNENIYGEYNNEINTRSIFNSNNKEIFYGPEHSICVIAIIAHGSFEMSEDAGEDKQYFDTFNSPFDFDMINTTSFGVCNYASPDSELNYQKIVYDSLINADIENPNHNRLSRVTSLLGNIKHKYSGHKYHINADVKVDKLDKPYHKVANETMKNDILSYVHKDRYYINRNKTFLLNPYNMGNEVINKNFYIKFEDIKLAMKIRKYRYAEKTASEFYESYPSTGFMLIPTEENYFYPIYKNILYDMIDDDNSESYVDIDYKHKYYIISLKSFITFLHDKKYNDLYKHIIIMDHTCAFDDMTESIQTRLFKKFNKHKNNNNNSEYMKIYQSDLYKQTIAHMENRYRYYETDRLMRVNELSSMYNMGIMNNQNIVTVQPFQKGLITFPRQFATINSNNNFNKIGNILNNKNSNSKNKNKTQKRKRNNSNNRNRNNNRNNNRTQKQKRLASSENNKSSQIKNKNNKAETNMSN